MTLAIVAVSASGVATATVGAPGPDASNWPAVLPAPADPGSIKPHHVLPEFGAATESGRTRLKRDFALFRRSSRAGETASARQVITGKGETAQLVQRGDQLCIVVGGPSACGPITLAASKPVVLVLEARSGSDTVIYGPASDDVGDIVITSSNGSTARAKPLDNVFQVKATGSVRGVQFVMRDGTRHVIVDR